MQMLTHAAPPVVPGLLRRRDVAVRLGISLSAVDLLDRRGHLRAVRIPAMRAVRYRAGDVEALLARWSGEAADTAAGATA